MGQQSQGGLGSARGFGLIELMVTLLVMAAVLAGIYLSFFGMQHQSNRMTKVAEMRQSARTCIQLMEREIRMAGSGWGRLTVYGSKNGNVRTRVPTAAVINPTQVRRVPSVPRAHMRWSRNNGTNGAKYSR